MKLAAWNMFYGYMTLCCIGVLASGEIVFSSNTKHFYTMRKKNMCSDSDQPMIWKVAEKFSTVFLFSCDITSCAVGQQCPGVHFFFNSSHYWVYTVYLYTCSIAFFDGSRKLQQFVQKCM